MRLVAIYIEQFQIFGESTFCFDDRFKFTITRSERNEREQYHISIDQTPQEFNVFDHMNAKVTGIIGSNGSGKTTISILLRNIFSNKPILSNVLVIYVKDEVYFIDRYKGGIRTMENIPLHLEVVGPIDLINMAEVGVGHENKWSNLVKESRLVYNSGMLGAINETIFSEQMINLSLDYKIRKFLSKERLIDLLSEDDKYNLKIGGFDVITPYYKDQFKNFLSFINFIKHPAQDEIYTILEDKLILPKEFGIGYKVDSKKIKEAGNAGEFGWVLDKLTQIINVRLNERPMKDQTVFYTYQIEIPLLMVFFSLPYFIEKVGNMVGIKAASYITDVGADWEGMLNHLNDEFDNPYIKELEQRYKEYKTLIHESKVSVESTMGLYTFAVDVDEQSFKLWEATNKLNDILGINFFYCNWLQRISSGEQAILGQLSDWYHIKDDLKNEPIFLIDETDLYLHYEWQRQYLDLILSFLNYLVKGNFQLIFATHSAMNVSDIPKQNLIFLERVGNETRIHNSLEMEKTFGGNLMTIVSSNFFLGAPMGEFASKMITEALDYIYTGKSNIFDEKSLEEFIEMIGEPVIVKQLRMLIELKKQGVDLVTLLKEDDPN